MAIAIQLGVARETVRRARERLGIEAAPPGRRRGVPMSTVTSGRPPVSHPTAMVIVSRFAREQQRRVPATESLLAERIRALQEAKTAGDELAYDDALLAINSLTALMWDHRQKVRAA